MPINWKAVEDAVRAWVVGASGFADQLVIWRSENGNAPTQNYIDVALGSIIPIGEECQLHDFDAGQPPGQEVELRVEGDREFTVSAECFTRAATEQSAETTARAVLSKVQTRLKLPSVRDALYVVGVAPFDLGQIAWIPAVIETGFQGRALLEVRFYARDDASERTGYIKTVEVLDTATGDVIIVDS